MVKTFKVYITKERTPLDEALVLGNCHKIFVKSVTVFLNYNNLDETYFYNYDVDGTNRKVTFKEGYYTFSTLKNLFENIGSIELEEEKYTGKCKLRSDKKINLKTLGPILGF